MTTTTTTTTTTFASGVQLAAVVIGWPDEFDSLFRSYPLKSIEIRRTVLKYFASKLAPKRYFKNPILSKSFP